MDAIGMRRLAALGVGCTVALSASPLPRPASIARLRAGRIEIVAVKALPANKPLRRGVLNVVVVKPGLALYVAIRNTSTAGHSVTVRITLPQTLHTARTVVKTRTLLLPGGQSRAATFGNLGQVDFAIRTPLKVTVATKVGGVTRPVSAAVYPVIFSLG